MLLSIKHLLCVSWYCLFAISVFFVLFVFDSNLLQLILLCVYIFNASLNSHGNYSLLCASCGSPRCESGVKYGMSFIHWIINTLLFVLHGHHIVISLISVLCHAVYYLVIHLWVFCCCVFVPFLVVSGKLKCHPSPIHRPDRDRKLSQPPFILLLSPLHPPISTHVSVVMGNSDKRTLMGKNMLSLGLQGKAASFHSIISPLCALPNTPSYSRTNYVCISNDSFQIAFL